MALARTQSFQVSVPLGLARTLLVRLLLLFVEPLGMAILAISARGTLGTDEDSVIQLLWYPRECGENQAISTHGTLRTGSSKKSGTIASQ